MSDLFLTDTLTEASAKQLNTFETHTEEAGFKLTPNPARNTVYIYPSSLSRKKDFKISVLSITGAVIKTINCKTSGKVIEVDVSSLSEGAYILQASSGLTRRSRTFVKL